MTTPMAERIQILAADVTPTTAPSLASITPAPKKPTPVITWPMILEGSDMEVITLSAVAIKMYVPSTINEEVRMPTGFPLICLSKPIIVLQNRAVKTAVQSYGEISKSVLITDSYIKLK